MPSKPPTSYLTDAFFSTYMGDYDRDPERGLSVSGENKEYFAQVRVGVLSACLSGLSEKPRAALDFCCGTGGSVPFLLNLPGVDSVLGFDISLKLLEVAERAYGSERAQCIPTEQYVPARQIDLVFCNGVFHHIPVPKRAEAMRYIYTATRSGGIFAFWENNPWNPGTRYVMARIPFDRDAQTLSARAALHGSPRRP